MNTPEAPQGGDKTLVILCHLSLLLGVGFVLPFIVYLVKRQESPWVAEQAKEVLNFHFSVILYAIISIILFFFIIGIPLLFAVIVGSFICAIIGAIRASEGIFYRYPLTIRLI